MKLIVGLGNPESRYNGTRHNVGFARVEAYAQRLGVDWQDRPKFKGWLAETTRGGEKVLLLKPTTYYNLSGTAVRAVKDFYKIDNHDILITHDELALPFGTLRTRLGGSDAGNNGIKSLNAHIGPDYARIRIGIGGPLRARMGDVEFVLGQFSSDEQKVLTGLQPKIDELIESFLAGSFEATTHQAGE